MTAAVPSKPSHVTLKTLKVTVVPKGIEIVNITRQANQNDVSVDVAVQKKVAFLKAMKGR